MGCKPFCRMAEFKRGQGSSFRLWWCLLRLRATQGLRSECRHSCNGRTVAEVLVVQIRDGGSEKVGSGRVSNHLFFETSFGGEKWFTVSKKE